MKKFRLVVIAADDVAPPGKRHRLGLVVDTLAALGDGQRHERRGIVEHEVAYQFVGALEPLARFQFRGRLRTDHAAIGDNANATDREPLGEPVDHRNQAAGIGGVARPHLRANRPPVHHHGDHKIAMAPRRLILRRAQYQPIQRDLADRANGPRSFMLTPIYAKPFIRESLQSQLNASPSFSTPRKPSSRPLSSKTAISRSMRPYCRSSPRPQRSNTRDSMKSGRCGWSRWRGQSLRLRWREWRDARHHL